MAEECGAENPEAPTLTCTRPTPCFMQHQAWGFEGGTQRLLASWPNPNQPPSAKPRKGGLTRPTSEGPKTAGPPEQAWRDHIHNPANPTDTQSAAAASVLPKTGTMRRAVFDYIADHGGGATDEEIQNALEMNPSTVRPRRLELVGEGLIMDSGVRRLTASGEKAIVWIVK